ncbi:MAG: sulfite exporter TauE/SafE family protein [Ruminiclostridium sp.]|nr:sulfite exporter TauE/SafE family protein [Ruminiclostridium sp.]
MKTDNAVKIKSSFIGLTSGVLNGLFGSGGGIAAVPLLEKLGIEPKKSHATSVIIIFFLSIAATIGYCAGGSIDFQTAFSYIPAGIAGAVMGTVLLKKIDNSVLRRIFGVIMLISAVRMITG